MINLPGLTFDHGEDIAALREAVQQFAQDQIAPRAADERLVAREVLDVAHFVVDRLLRCAVRERRETALVVRCRALRDERHRACALEVVHGHDWRVHGQLLVVRAETVAVRVRVREQARLQDGIRRGLDKRHEMRGREGSLWN